MGFEEVRHTADWAILVWGKDLESIFIDSAQGMYSLMGIQSDRTSKKTCSLTIQGDDHESLLVAFLSELLFIAEEERSVYEKFNLVFNNDSLKVNMDGYGILYIQKLIKAVTFHNLEIKYFNEKYQTEIVFDV